MSIRLGRKVRVGRNVSIGGILDPAQVMARRGDSVPLLWLPEVGVSASGAEITSWLSTNKIGSLPGASVPVPASAITLSSAVAADRPDLVTLDDANKVRRVGSDVVSSETGAATLQSASYLLGYLDTLGSGDPGDANGYMYGFLVARAKTVATTAPVVKITCTDSGENVVVRVVNDTTDYWQYQSDDSDHSSLLGGSGSTPVTGGWQMVNWGFNPTYGTNNFGVSGAWNYGDAGGPYPGYDWGTSSETATAIELFTYEPGNEIEVAGLFFTTGYGTLAERTAITSWIMERFPGLGFISTPAF